MPKMMTPKPKKMATPMMKGNISPASAAKIRAKANKVLGK